MNSPPLISFSLSGRKVVTGKIWDDANDAKLRGLVKNLKLPDSRLVLHVKHRSSWMNVWVTKVTGAVLSYKGYRDFLRTL